MSGYGDGSFRPYADVTRGQAAKIIANAAGYVFWLWIERLHLHGAISGYDCGAPGEPCDEARRPYYRLAANLTRAQLAKIAVAARGYQDAIPASRQTFADVPNGDPFWLPVERVAQHHGISGYSCGGSGEPCDGQQRPYYRPAARITRGQTAKIPLAPSIRAA